MAKILIIEDDPRLEKTYDTIFAHHGHTVVRAHDGEEGLQVAEAENPDIILLDVLMPKVNGIEFLRQFDIKNKHPNTKVIMFSNMDSADLQTQAAELGATSYQVKSRFSPNELAQLINETLAQRPIQQPPQIDPPAAA